MLKTLQWTTVQLYKTKLLRVGFRRQLMVHVPPLTHVIYHPYSASRREPPPGLSSVSSLVRLVHLPYSNRALSLCLAFIIYDPVAITWHINNRHRSIHSPDVFNQYSSRKAPKRSSDLPYSGICVHV